MKLEKLDFIDWRFEDAKTNSYTHDYHPYPAKFIPQIPSTLMEYFSEEGDVVWDPFCGCGTAVVEAIRKDRKAVGTDLNPLATLMTRAKSTPLEPESLTQNVQNHLSDVKQAHNFQEDYQVPDIPKLNGWFSENAIRELSIIKGYIEDVEDDNLQDFLKTGFSSIIVNVSYQDSNTRYTRVENEMERGKTIRKYENKLNRMIQGMEDFHEDCDKKYSPTIKSQDLREDFTLDEKADLIITSPPYPNAYDYHLYHKYRMFWLDMKPRQMKHNEIGAHLVYQNRSKEENIEKFRDNMSNCLQNLQKNTKEGGRLCMIIGDSKLEGEIVRNNELMKEIAEDTEFEVEKEFFRNIDSSKKTFNPENARAKKEAILVFKR
jgi:site-specific DNA-methyltransferase (cytosine-N4-specific)